MIACPRCPRKDLPDERALIAHLVNEPHLQNATQAAREAHEAATGIRLDEDGACDACHRRDGTHTPSCHLAKTALAAGYIPGPVVLRAKTPAMPPPALDQVGADKTAADPEFKPICSNCNQNPATPGKAWCDDCREVARKRSSGRRTKVPVPATTTAPAPPVALAAVQDPARVAQRIERPTSSGEDGGSNPSPRSTPTPAPPAISSAPKEIPMAKADPAACKLCARLTKKAGETTKCKWHGGAGHPKSGGSKKATGGGKGESKKSKPPKTRAVRNTTAVAFGARVDSMLTAAKVRVTQLRADLASEEKKVEILTELVGA